MKTTDIYVDSINCGVSDNGNNETSIMEEHIAHPFADELKLNVDDHVDLPPDARVDMCIYLINRYQSSIPFLEFLLYLDGNMGDKKRGELTFPYILHKHAKCGMVEQCSAPLSALFSTNDDE